MEIGRIERRKAFLRTLLSLAICLSLLLTVKAFAAQTIGPLSISLSDKNLVATYEGVRASKTIGTGKDGRVDVVVDGGNSFTATVKSAHKYAGSSSYPASNMTITLKNGYDTPARLKFSYTITDGKGTVTVDQINESGEVTRKPFNKEIPGGGDITIKIVSSANKVGCNSGVVLKIEDIELEQVVTTATTTFRPGEHGSYTVNGKKVDKEISYMQKSTEKYTLEATADEGYIFLGWRSKTGDTERYHSTKNPDSFGITDNCTIWPVFISEDSAQFRVGDQVFYDLNEANKYALTQSTKTIVLIKSGTIPVDQYKIDSGVTLLIPYSDSTEVRTTKPSNSNTEDIKTNRSAYRTLTVPSGTTINVYGALNVDGQISKNKSLPTGQYGLITLESGAEINLGGKDENGVDKGGNLYCWGYINGDGLVTANSGANVYESFQLTGWRGGGASSTIVGDAGKKRVFPINQYYIQNVEAALQFHYGAKEYVYASVEVTIPLIGKQQYDVTTEFISMNAGMFRLQPGCTFTKKYIPATDRMLFEVDGDFTIGTMALNFTTIISLKTEQYDLPINSNFSVDIRSGTTTIAPNQNIALLPGAKFTVSHGAEFVAESNMYVYDRDEWIGKNYAYGGDLRVVGYSTTNGTTTMRTAADLVDATIDVNGKLRIRGTKGGIYTTKNPNDPDRGSANIFSSEGTGQVIFDIATKDEATAYQVRQKGNDVEGYDEIPCDSAQLRNGNGTYTTTAGAGAEWTYKYDTVQQRWYRFRVDYQFNGKNIGYDLITTDTATRDVRNYVSDGSSLVGTVTSGTADTPTISGGTLKVTGVRSDCTINIEGVAASYTPYFVLNEHQYSVYLSYGGAEITNTVQENKKTYYVVQNCGTMKFGAALSAPKNETMGVSEDRHNSITWFLEDVTTGAQQFMGTVPSGTTKGKPVYIYGIYNGAVAHNSYTNEYYTNLKDAIVDLPVTGSATLTMYANCGTFEDESKTASYSLSANITFDVNGKEAWGSLVNNGTLTLDLNGGSVRYITGATAGSTSYRASAAVINNGTMTIQDSKGGGVISTDAVCDDNVRYDLKNHASAIRNLGSLAMESIRVSVDQSVNDWVTAVMNYNGGVITSMNNCSVVCTRGYGITNYGGTIQTISGGTINGGDAAMAGRYGIQNRNMRSGSGTEAAPYVISKLGTIDTISGLTVYVYQYGINNYATVNCITGDTSITASNSYAIRNQVGWYDTSQTPKVVTTEANNVKTMVYTYDTVNFPTIKEISGNVTLTANANYAVWNDGNIEKISGGMNGNGVCITTPKGSYALENSGYIKEISGKTAIKSFSVYAIAQNVWKSENARRVAQTYIQKDVNGNGDYTSTGDIREYKYEYISPVIDKIGGDNSEITISGTRNVVFNIGTINSITDGVTITATEYNAIVNGTDGGGCKTCYSVRTNLGKDSVAKRYETRIEDERTYYPAKIGSISGNVIIKSGTSGALVNGGTIDSIESGVTLQASSSTIQNQSFTYSQMQFVYLGYNATSVFGASNEAGRDYAYTATEPIIKLIDRSIVQATSGDHAIVNGGTIGTIQNATISAKGAYAINNSSNIITERKIYKDNTHTTTYALTELFGAFFKKDAATGKYTSVAASATPNHVDSYGVIPTITVIGAGNTISATKQTIYNRGEITNIDSGSATKTSITATEQGTSGQAIYNLSALAGTKTFTGGSSGVDGDYKTPAHIGTIRNVNVTAAYRAIQNGDAGNYLNVIDEIGANTDARATGNVKGGAAVYNASKNAQIKSITNGTYTAATAGNYAVYNDSTTYAITIEGGYFKGGLADTANRAHAIYEADTDRRQTYPEGCTLSNKPNKDGYYYIAEKKFVLKFDANGSTTYPATGTVDAMTVTLPAESVTLPANGFTRSGYIFAGWALDKNTGADNAEKLLDGSIKLSELGDPGAGDEVTLYAIWKPNKVYNVTVNWNGTLAYTYVPSVYQWDAQNLCYKILSNSYWKGVDPTVTVTNVGGNEDGVTYGSINAGIGYTKKTGYDTFYMNFYIGDETVAHKNTATLASGLMPGGQSAKARMELIGTLPSGMAQGTLTIGTVALTLTTAD